MYLIWEVCLEMLAESKCFPVMESFSPDHEFSIIFQSLELAVIIYAISDCPLQLQQ